MDAFDLTGHVAVVTGGNRGIGLGLARGLAQAGATVAIWARDEVRNRDTVGELEALGAAALAVGCDVASEDSVGAAMDYTVAELGKVDSFFANAGTSGLGKPEDFQTHEWKRLLDVNLDGVFYCTRAAARHMLERGEGGSIVITASVVAHHGLPLAPHYTASKGAVAALARSLSNRLARHGIRVNTLSPGWVDTEMTESVQADEKASGYFLARTPMRRWGTAADFEGAAVFLASPASGFMTGAELVLDGGFSAS